jgi:hypothetical protein
MLGNRRQTRDLARGDARTEQRGEAALGFLGRDVGAAVLEKLPRSGRDRKAGCIRCFLVAPHELRELSREERQQAADRRSSCAAIAHDEHLDPEHVLVGGREHTDAVVLARADPAGADAGQSAAITSAWGKLRIASRRVRTAASRSMLSTDPRVATFSNRPRSCRAAAARCPTIAW